MTCRTTKELQCYLIALCGITIGTVTISYNVLSTPCCTEPKKDCLTCQLGAPAYDFCWENSGLYDCGFRILVTIVTHEQKGYVKFISSTIKRYLHLEENDIVVFDNNSNDFSKDDLQEWFGEKATILGSDQRLTLSNIQSHILQHFISSDHEVLLIIDSQTVLHRDWRNFINLHIKNSDGVLSLYRSKNKNVLRNNCSNSSCTVSSLTNFGMTLDKRTAQKLLTIGNSDLAEALQRVTNKILAPTRSLVLRFGRHQDIPTCNTDDASLDLTSCHFPSWIKEGIEFFQIGCPSPRENYVEKDSLPRNERNEVKKIGVMLISTSAFETSEFLQNLTPTFEHIYVYKLFVGVHLQSAVSEMDQYLQQILFEDTALQIVPLGGCDTFSEKMNRIFKFAYSDDMDYFAHIPRSKPFVPEDKGWTTCSIERIKSHKPPNVGVVSPSCHFSDSSSINASFISRLHYDIYGMLYPATLSEKNALKWISGTYNQVIFHAEDDGETVEIPSLEDMIVRGYEVFKNWSRPVVSFSLYGSNTRYTDGAITNMELMPKYFSGWQMWVYHDDSVPESILEKMCENGVNLIDMTGFPLKNQMSWRFLVASEPVIRFIVRDIDSRLSKRDRAAVEEWVSSGKKFHTIRDHPNHGLFPINGGMWGGTYDAIPNLKSLLLKNNPSGHYLQDMNFLNNVVWYYYAKYSVMQHDEVSEGRFGRRRPFPLPPEGNEFVGDVYIDGKQVA